MVNTSSPCRRFRLEPAAAWAVSATYSPSWSASARVDLVGGAPTVNVSASLPAAATAPGPRRRPEYEPTDAPRAYVGIHGEWSAGSVPRRSASTRVPDPPAT